MDSGTSKDGRTLESFAEVIRDGVETRSQAELDQGFSEVLARITAQRSRRRVVVRWPFLGVAAAVCVLFALHLRFDFTQRMRLSSAPTPGYQIQGGSVLEGGYLRARGSTGIELVFHEGSKVVLAPGAHGRLRTVDADGARLAVDDGSASFNVTPGTHRRWAVEVGPFLIAVKGTVFTVSWSPKSEQFELRLRHGRVVVSGPMSGGDIALRAGQRLRVSLPRAETLITEDRPEQPLDEAPPVPAPPTPTPPAPTPPRSMTRDKPASSPSPATFAPKPERQESWAQELAKGHWDRILEDVERSGTAAALDRASSEDLYALANAARYRRRTDLARAALLAERRRFPGSARALDATFLLGRVEESVERGASRAIAWYDVYLTQAPSGAYVSEALGRKMILTSDLSGPDKARPIAEAYLRRFPQGSYADSARALSRAP